MDIKRVLTTVIGLPIVILISIFGNKYIISLLIAIMAILAMKEYINCVSKKAKVISWISYLSVASIGLIHVFSNDLIKYLPLLIPSLLLILFLHIIITNMKINFQDITYTFMGIIYILGFISFIPLLYGYDNGNVSGKILIWFTIISAWGTDIFAFIVGRNIGKTKFSKVSPNKSIEGCIGGTLGAIILNFTFTYILNTYFNFEISYLAIVIISFVLSIIGQIGDFAASSIKRYFEIKDFSELFPGHGGMIDRIDSVMFIAPFAYFLLINFL